MFREMLEALPHAICAHAWDGRVVFVNEAFARLFDRPRATLLANVDAWIEAVVPEDRASVRTRLERAYSGRAACPLGEFRWRDAEGAIRRGRGSLRPFEVSSGPHAGSYWLETVEELDESNAVRESAREAGELVEQAPPEGRDPVVAVGRDHAREPAAMQALRWSDERFGELLRNLPGVPWLFDVRSRACEFIGPGFEAIWGRPPATGPDAADVFLSWIHPDDVERAMAPRRALADPSIGSVDAEYRIVRPDGGVRWLHTRTVAVRDASGSVSQLVGFDLDETPRHDAEQELRASEDRFGELLRNLPGVPWLYDLARRQFVFVGPGFEGIWGRPPATEPNGPDWLLAWIHPDDVEQAMAPRRLVTDRLLRSVDSEYRVIRPDGEVRWVHTRTVPVRNALGKVTQLAGFDLDETERQDAERERRSSEERLERMSEAMHEAFFLVSAGGRELLYVNDAITRITGVARERVYEAPTELLHVVAVDDRARVTALLARPWRGGATREARFEFRIVRADGAVRWLEAWVSPIHDASGALDHFVGTLRDISDRKGVELALRERTEQLERSVREKSALLAEVHHRVKNNLQSITGLVHLMAAPAQRRPMSETIADLERRIHAMALVHETLYRSSDLGAVDMQTYLERLGVALLTALRPAAAAIDITVLAPGMTLDLESAVRCGFIANELVGNALKHAFPTRARGRVEVRAHREGETLVLRVSDDGVGMPRDLDFESEATLGLRLVAGLAEQMDGAVRRVPGEPSAIEVVCRPHGR